MIRLAMQATCRRCGGHLSEVNAGCADGATSSWVGKCDDCGYSFVVRATMTPLARMRELVA